MKIQHQTTSKESKKVKLSSLVTGSVIALLIAATPYIFYTYKSFPHEKVWETFLFTYEANWYQEIYTSVWTMMTKFIPLFLLTIWFFTCKHWWYHIILIPMGMFLFQLISVFNDDLKYTDETEFWYVLPVMLVLVPFIYLIRAKLFYSILDDDLEQFEEELKTRKSIISQLKDLFR